MSEYTHAQPWECLGLRQLGRTRMQSVEEGIVVKQADDLYCGADTPEQLVVNFTRALAYKCLQSNTWLLIIMKL